MKTRRRRRRNLKKKESQKQEICSDLSESCIDSKVAEVSTMCTTCSTPKGQKFRIPKVSTCPPAPKKKPRLLSSNCTLRKSPLQLFAPLELDIFFSIVLPEVSVPSLC
ncbi:hypothetical protein Lal_00036205 [Lupinus albus]|uniref:Uncharacterized protein n=1 Tax=Lupinus albus TaxID=3870 RepID=A0A6A4QMG9_LUPAL|nr:hypothetical protein Lalb_Chr04g0247411 [Lupinus albus]KAE9614716.1 hypothetical protein Lalb_Chr04g0247651 [Lupinus albus]KAF1868767.1 hypothetical protein Lal_00036205 [Lupinus albus]